MLQIALNELSKVVKGELITGPHSGEQMIRGISTDSREIAKDNLFVAIPGERFDGHRFIEESAERGAKAAMVARDKKQMIDQKLFQKISLILVEDTRRALGELASWYRRKFDIPAVAVTGTNGKTTTKDMIAEVLSSRFRVLKSPRSYNNLVGVPLTLFQLNSDSEVLVVELGMSGPGEIGLLTRVSRPTMGVITNIGPAHLESMQSVEKIAQAKFELPENMSSPRTLILNADDRILMKRMEMGEKDERVISFGIRKRADFIADEIGVNEEGYVNFRVNGKVPIQLKLLGEHNIYNALAAFAVGVLFGIDHRKIKRKLEGYSPPELRMELVRIGDIKVINDSYNANPVSMEKALETLKNLKSRGRKVAVLGDMLELGEKAKEFHLQVGKKAASTGVDLLILVGELARFIGEGAEQAGMNPGDILVFENNQKVSHYLLDNLKGGDVVLVKGSRKMKTEEVVLALKSLYGRSN